MSKRTYLTRLEQAVERGQTFNVPRGYVHLAGRKWRVTNAGADPTRPLGAILLETDVPDATHAVIKALADVEVLLLENASGTPLADTATLGQIPAAKRTSVTTALEARGVPVSDLVASTTIAQLRARIRKYFVLRRVLGMLGANIDATLQMRVGDLSATARATWRARLERLGYSLAGVQMSMTIRDVVILLLNQGSDA